MLLCGPLGILVIYVVDDAQTSNLLFPRSVVCSPVSFQTTPADPIIKRVETVGKVLPHVTAKIVDQDGKVVPKGTPGEMLVKGYLVQKGYSRLRLIHFREG